MIKKIPHFLLIITAILPFLVFAGGNGAPPAIVQVDKAVNIEIAPFIWVNGTVIGRFDSKIAAEVDGRLENILDVGDRVEQGDVIARIDDRTYHLAVNEIQSEIQPIETMVEFYRREAERLSKLAQQNNAAKNQLDQTEANRDEALARIKVVKARLAIAQDDLERTVIRAPFSGVISERIKSPGERVDVGEQVVRLINTDTLEIQAFIQQESFYFIKEGDSLLLKGPEGNAEGIVRTVIPVGDDLSRLYEIRVEFAQENWPVGTAVRLATPVKQKQNVIAVPRDALVKRQSGR